MRAQRPHNEHAAAVDAAPYEKARRGLLTPELMVAPEREVEEVLWMFVPETRFSCRECRHPVSVSAEACPFCRAPVVPPEPDSLDHDNDGMPTEWERRFGLDPNDPSDAHEDLDGDGYTNLEEFLADTDPSDPQSRPSAVAIGKVTLDRIAGTQFGLQFTSRVRTQDGGFRFGVNYRLPDGTTKTDFVLIGGMVADFKVLEYEEKMVRADPPRLGVDDLSELVLQTPKGTTITLVKDRPEQYVELVAYLTLKLRGEEERMEVRKGEKVVFDGREYTVIDIDAQGRRVVIQGSKSRLETTIRQATE